MPGDAVAVDLRTPDGPYFSRSNAVTRVESFPPIESPDAELLILGSMPGPASLMKNQYYGHPQNHFWRILGEILGFDPTDPYESRVAAVTNARIAIWDVLRSCIRPGALDSAIVAGSAEINDFPEFLGAHPHLRRIVFNGTTAKTVFLKRAVPLLGSTLDGIELVRVPSTSPANASIPMARKMAEWREACAIWTISSKR